MESDETVASQMQQFAESHCIRAIDIFKAWDRDGDGHLTQKEWRKLLPTIGLQVIIDAQRCVTARDGHATPCYAMLRHVTPRHAMWRVVTVASDYRAAAQLSRGEAQFCNA